MAWSLIGVSTVAEDATGNFTLNAPAGTPTIGDLLVACIGFRSNVSVSPPAGEGWNLVPTQQTSGDTDAESRAGGDHFGPLSLEHRIGTTFGMRRRRGGSRTSLRSM